MKVADAILRYLKTYNVQYTFGIPAITVSPFFDALNDIKIKTIIAKSSCGAAYMAAKFASVSKKLALYIGDAADSYNMTSGVKEALSAKAPVILITGYFKNNMDKKKEADEKEIVNIFRSITKYSNSIDKKREALSIVEEAVKTALKVPQGPVHILVPVDLLMDEFEDEWIQQKDSIFELGSNGNTIEADEKKIKEASNAINTDEKGIILVGKGCRGASELVIALSEKLQWPIITTPGGKGVVSSDHPMSLGTYSYCSTDAALNYAADEEVKSILILGASLGQITNKNWNSDLIRNRKIIRIDWDEAELNNLDRPCIKILGDIRRVIPELINNLNKSEKQFIKPFLNIRGSSGHRGLPLKVFLDKLPSLMPLDTYYICDAGEYAGLVFKYLCIPASGDFEINMNHEVMGSGLAGAIGVHLANEKRTVAVFTGVRSFFINGNEIFTAKDYGNPIIYFIFNNSNLQEMQQTQLYLYGRALREFKRKKTNIYELVKAGGIRAIQIKSINEIDMISDFISKLDGPAVIELLTDKEEILQTIHNYISMKMKEDKKDNKGN